MQERIKGTEKASGGRRGVSEMEIKKESPFLSCIRANSTAGKSLTH